jgi:lipopolysaccharide assembly protein A
MRFLKTVFWTLIAVVAAIFGANNWTPVAVNIWNGMIVDTYLPLLLLIAFLIGVLPTFLLHRATRWSMRRKLESTQRALADAQRAEPILEQAPTIPPVAAPIAVPPGVL